MGFGLDPQRANFVDSSSTSEILHGDRPRQSLTTFDLDFDLDNRLDLDLNIDLKGQKSNVKKI